MESEFLVKRLRDRACPAGEPWTGMRPEQDHGHTDCVLFHAAADEIERLSRSCTTLLARLYAWQSKYGRMEPSVDDAKVLSGEVFD